MRLISAAAVVALAAGSVPCHAQVRVERPMNLTWPEQPDLATYDEFFVNMLVTVVHEPYVTGEQAAIATAQEIRQRLGQGKLALDGPICILLKGFAHDISDPGWEGNRIYDPEDVLPNVPFVGLPADDPFGYQAWKHPFLRNADSTNPNARLRLWVVDFCETYRDLQFNAPPNDPLPSPTAFFEDSEVRDGMLRPHLRNPAIMLHHLATANDVNGNPYYTKQLTGYPAGTTLKTLYDGVKVAYGFPGAWH